MQIRLILLGLGIMFGVISLGIARSAPGFSFVGTSFDGALALVGTGWALIVCAFLFMARRPKNKVGPLLFAAASAWFIAEWDNPGVASSLAFTIGIALYAACPPIVAWATLAYPSGRLSSWVQRVAITAALGNAVLVLGLLPALVFDPEAIGCAQCPRNLLLITNRADLFDDFNRVGVHVGLFLTLIIIMLAGWRVVRSGSTRLQVIAPVVLSGGLYLGAVAGTFAASLDRGYMGSSPFERRQWLAQALALTALAGSVAWGLLRARRARSDLARLIVELGEVPTGGLRDALARTLDDPELQIAYPADENRFVDVRGHPIDLSPAEGRADTKLTRDGRPVAVLIHKADLADNPELIEEVTSTARLAFENERLQAEVRAQLQDLQASRARIIEAGDAERRKLERDLHDGAQQRLVALSLVLRIQRAHLGPNRPPRVAALLSEADAELNRVITNLRELAHGIHPAVLSDEGIAAAVEALAEQPRSSLRIASLTSKRFPEPVETAAYLVVAEVAKGGARVNVTNGGDVLIVDVETTSEQETLIDLEDRVGALNGSLKVEKSGGGAKIRAEIPCA